MIPRMKIRLILPFCALAACAPPSAPPPSPSSPPGEAEIVALVTPEEAHFLFPPNARTVWTWDQPSSPPDQTEYRWQVDVPLAGDSAFSFGYSRYPSACPRPGEGSLADLLNRGGTVLFLNRKTPTGSTGSRVPTAAVQTRMLGNRVLVSIMDPALVRRVLGHRPESVALEVQDGAYHPPVRVPVRYTPSLADARFGLAGPDYSAPAGAPYTAEEVRIPTAAGLVLAGTLTRPRAAAPPPVAVLITGSGADERDYFGAFRQVADALGRRGIAVLRLDDRGVGRSTGDMETAGTLDRADDIREALRYLRTRADLDVSRLALVGHSEGGLIAPLLATTDDGIDALVLLGAPGSSADSIAAFQGERRARACPQAAGGGGPGQVRPWMEFMRRHDPLATARRVRVPVLVMHGAADEQVPPGDAALLAEALRAGGNGAVQVRVLQGLPHGLDDPRSVAGEGGFAPEVMRTLVDWLAVQLRP
jgi:dipeptidyl aminopeptidase/acylaminoacyl peptidase